MSTAFAWCIGLLALVGLLLGMVVDARTGHPGMGYLAALAFMAVPAGVVAWWIERQEERRKL